VTEKEIMKRIDAGEKPKEVLLVEDSPGDVRLTREAFRSASAPIRLHVATDGVEALAFLKKEGLCVVSPRPDLILLDLNMPRMDGREVLAYIKADNSLKTIPTIILTVSDAESDIAKSYELNASCYLTKPGQLEEFEKLVKSVSDFWLKNARLPPQSPAASVIQESSSGLERTS
jgi:chemotaxis family two-component system response regulator Rcp1